MSDETHDGNTTGISVEWSRHWRLDPGIAFLNHGSFGATPTRVLNRQRDLRAQLEENPVRFFNRVYPSMLDHARAELAAFVGADPAGLAFTTNTTTAINTILRSRALDPADEILVTNHAYPACRHAAQFVAERSGARVRIAEIPLDVDGPDAIVDALLENVTPKTDIALVDHVTSPTAVVFPIERIVGELEERRVDTLVDGAHAPGMLDLDVESIAPTYYVGNCHKWICAPKGAAFLWAGEHERDDLHPLVVSNWYRQSVEGRPPFRMEFDWTGTRDPTAWLSVPTAIDHMASLVPNGWEGLRERNSDLVRRARRLLCETLEVEPPVPESMLGTMAAVPLPDRPDDVEPGPFGIAPLQRELAEEHGIEVAVNTWPEPPRRHLRISAQLYNEFEQYERLAELLA